MKVEELEKRKSRKITSSSPSSALINNLDDGCLMHIFSFLSPIPETEQRVAQAFISSVIDFKRDPWPKVSDNAKDLNIHGYKMPRKHPMFHWVRLKARLKQFSAMNKLKKRALRIRVKRYT